MVTILDPNLQALTVAEKLNLIDLLWASIPEDELPVPQFHKDLIAERLAEYHANPDEGQTWEEVLKELENEQRARN